MHVVGEAMPLSTVNPSSDDLTTNGTSLPLHMLLVELLHLALLCCIVWRFSLRYGMHACSNQSQDF